MIVDLRGLAARSKRRRSAAIAAAFVIAAFLLSRALYCAFGVRFDAAPLQSFYQFIDPALLRTRLAESIFYLRDQPPLFNLFCGVVLKLAPVHATAVFHIVYFAIGLAWSLGLLWLLIRLGVPCALGAALTVVLLVAPTTVLYENWLMYEYPLLGLLVLSALFLHRYVISRRRFDGAVLFSLLAAIVLLRGTFHLFWMLAVIGCVMLADRANAARTLRLAVIPLLIVLAVYAKNWLVFSDWITGSLYGKLNLAIMALERVPVDERVRLYHEGKLTAASVTRLFDQSIDQFSHLAQPTPPTGVALLDQARKSNGAPNWHHRDMPTVADAYGRDALYMLRHDPGGYWQSVKANARRYFLPAHETYPFHRGTSADHGKLAPLLNAFDRFPGLQFHDYQRAWSLVVLILLAVAFGGLALAGPRALRRRIFESSFSPTADRAVLAFCLFNVLYVSLSTLLLSYADHNRYRFALVPLLAIIIAVAISTALRAWRRGNSNLRVASPRLNPRSDDADTDTRAEANRVRGQQTEDHSGIRRPGEHANLGRQHRPHEEPVRLGRTGPDPNLR